LDILHGVKATTVLAVLALLATGCTTAYWERPGASLPDLASESEACYQTAIAEESPAAFATNVGRPRLLPRTEPPPKLWKRAPREAALERFDEQLRYERCMRQRGWQPVRAVPPTL
jgi:hypothetical protein